jgi:hypothetical protein
MTTKNALHPNQALSEKSHCSHHFWMRGSSGTVAMPALIFCVGLEKSLTFFFEWKYGMQTCLAQPF